jgi:hypothetical protein
MLILSNLFKLSKGFKLPSKEQSLISISLNSLKGMKKLRFLLEILGLFWIHSFSSLLRDLRKSNFLNSLLSHLSSIRFGQSTKSR